MDETILERICNIGSVASGDNDTDALAMGLVDQGYVDVDGARWCFERCAIRWGPLVESDVRRVLSGEEAEYFLSETEWARRYRERRAISVPRGASPAGLVQMSEGLDEMMKALSHYQKQKEKYGVSREALDEGFACPREQRYFYQTDEWRRRAQAARFVGNYHCRRCNTTNRKLHVHHSKPILSAFSPNFCLNFAGWIVTVLCEDCHAEFHRQAVRDMSHFHGAPEAEVQAEKEMFRQLVKFHDDLGGCLFCTERIAERFAA